MNRFALASWALLALASVSCASLYDPSARPRYEGFGDRNDDAELFELARESKSPEDRSSHQALLKDLGQRHPDNVLVHRAYQDLMVAAGEKKECFREYNEKKLINPSAANCYYLARLTEAAEDAEPLLRAAIAKDRSFYWAQCALGLVKWELGDRDGARKYLEAATEINPEFAEGWEELAGFETTNLEGAQTAWKRYTTLRPQDMHGRMKLGLAYLEDDKHPKEARNQFELVLRRTPTNKEALFSMAAAEFFLNNVMQSKALYERILKLDPEEALAHYNLGILYEQRLENPRAALREYEIFQALTAPRESEFLFRRLQVAKWIETLRGKGVLPAPPTP